MAEKGFGVKEVNLIGASGTPTITSPNNLNLNAVNVAISTNASIGGNLTVSGTVGIAGTLTYEDVTNIDSVGVVTAREGIFIPDSKKLEIGNASGSGDLRLYHDGSNSYIQDAGTGDLIIKGSNNLDVTSAGNELKARFITNGAAELYHDNNKKLETTSSGATVTGTLTATSFSGPATQITVTDESSDTLTFPLFVTASVSGGLVQTANLAPQAGSNLYFNSSTGQLTASSFNGTGQVSNLSLSNTSVQVSYVVTANGSSAYRFAGNGIVSTEDNPDVYLTRGLKYRFVNNSGGSHPFQIREASGGSAYSSGVTNNGAASGNIDFQVPYSAPSRLYYQCTAHGGMVGNIYIRGANGNNDNVGLTTFTDNVVIQQSAGTDAKLEINEGTTSFPLRLTQTATEARIHSVADVPFNIRSQSGSGSGRHIAFWTRDDERLRIDSTGNVGINTDNPTARLEISYGVTASQKSAAWLDQYDNTTLRIFHNQTARLGLYTVEQGDWSSGVVLGTIDGSTTRKWGIGMASNGKSTYASGLYIGYRADTSNTGQNTFNTMAHSLILPTTGDVRVNVGNLVIATNNKGISFSGSSSSPDTDSTSSTRVITDYDEGTCDWELHRSDGLTTGSNTATTKVTYTKIGNRVMMSGYVYTASTGSSTSSITARLTDASGNAASLPYTPNHEGGLPVMHTRTITEYNRMSVSFAKDSKTVYVHKDDGTNNYIPNQNNVAISSPQTHLVIAFTGSYTTDE